jgi:hypothetical protein
MKVDGTEISLASWQFAGEQVATRRARDAMTAIAHLSAKNHRKTSLVMARVPASLDFDAKSARI